MDFGAVALSDDQKQFYRRLNETNVTLCAALPGTTQEKALAFLRGYSGLKDDRDSDFYRHYYAPSWTILNWLVHHDRLEGSRLTGQDISDAVSAHAMAMNLHSMDDHLNDGQMPANHLTLLLRSQSWMVMNEAFGRLATGVAGGTKIVDGFINDYYSAVCNCEKPESLDHYCDGFRKQMATALIIPVLVARKIGFDQYMVEALQHAYESFGIAWRLIDDIQDIEKDIAGREYTAIYAGLPPEAKNLLNEYYASKTAESNGDINHVFENLVADGVVDRIKDKAVSELESAAIRAGGIHLTGLADEFLCLAEPLKQRGNLSVTAYIQQSGCLVLADNTLSVEVTTHCNCFCNHCFVRASVKKLSSLPLEMVKAIISEGHGLGYRKLHITGGEPLLWSGLFEALAFAENVGFDSIFLNTNGTLLTGKIADRLASFESLKISVSLEGGEPLHDDVRGEGAYRQATKGIEKALEAEVEVSVFTTLRKRILPDISKTVFDIYDRFPSIRNVTLIQLIRVKDDFFSLSADLLTPDDFINAVQAASLLNLYGYKTTFLNNPLANVASKKMGIWGIPLTVPLHRAGDLVVKANQTAACAHSDYTHIGTYEGGLLKEILLSPGYRSAVAPDRTTCPKCKFSRLCEENAMVRPSNPYRNTQNDAPYCRKVLNRAVP